jgi:hypothetical protein
MCTQLIAHMRRLAQVPLARRVVPSTTQDPQGPTYLVTDDTLPAAEVYGTAQSRQTNLVLKS